MVDCTGFIEPLNLRCLLVNTFTGDGSMTIFIFIAFIFIAAVGASLRMMNMAILLMFLVFTLLFNQWLGGIFTLVLLVLGLVVSLIVARIVK